MSPNAPSFAPITCIVFFVHALSLIKGEENACCCSYSLTFDKYEATSFPLITDSLPIGIFGISSKPGSAANKLSEAG